MLFCDARICRSRFFSQSAAHARRFPACLNCLATSACVQIPRRCPSTPFCLCALARSAAEYGRAWTAASGRGRLSCDERGRARVRQVLFERVRPRSRREEVVEVLAPSQQGGAARLGGVNEELLLLMELLLLIATLR